MWEHLVLVLSANVFLLTEGSGLKISRQPETWPEARDQCGQFGGSLAVVRNLEAAKQILTKSKSGPVLGKAQEVWVGATLIDNGWKVKDSLRDPSDLFVYKGCFKQAFWTGGARFSNNNAKQCFKHCQWKGAVGLKVDFCICEGDLRNITRMQSSACKFRCAGNADEMCGDYHGVSVYQKRIHWAEGEPKPYNDCAYISRSVQTSQLEWLSGNCDMNIRYLCQFENDDKCGRKQNCLRWTSIHSTWIKSEDGCKKVNGTLAAFDTSDESKMAELARLPPGKFWVGMRRYREWQWLDGTVVNMVNFFRHERQLNSIKTCAVLQNINGELALSARSCSLKRRALCQQPYVEPLGGDPKGTRKFSTTEVTTLDIFDSLTNITISSEPTVDPVTSSWFWTDSKFLNTCLYVGIGFVAGMSFVIVIGLIICLCMRCSKKKRMQMEPIPPAKTSRRGDNIQVCYNSNNNRVRVTTRGDESDGTYDSVYDMQSESPFRQTQRLIRMGSSNSWRHSPRTSTKTAARRTRSAVSDNGNFTWKGVIGGKIEVINTQLRSNSLERMRRYDDVSYVVHRENLQRAAIKSQSPGTTPGSDNTSEYEYPCLDNQHYNVNRTNTPDSSSTYEPQENTGATSHYRSFVEAEALMNHQDDGLYATVNKSKTDAARSDDSCSPSDDMMFTVEVP